MGFDGLCGPFWATHLGHQQSACGKSGRLSVLHIPSKPCARSNDFAKSCFKQCVRASSSLASGNVACIYHQNNYQNNKVYLIGLFPKAPAKGFSLSTAAYFIFLNLFLLLDLPHSLFLTLFLLLHLPHSLFLTLFILLHLPYFIFFTNFLLLHPHNIII